MTPEAMAALHARCFDSTPRPWSAAEFAELQESYGVFLLTDQAAFLLGRVIADEAELLTLAVAPESRRGGLGRALTARFAAKAREKAASTAFLEVAEDNHGAKALYHGLGWREAGRRRGYYGTGRDALILRLALGF